MWAAGWLFKATGEAQYIQYLKANDAFLEGTTKFKPLFSWDDKRPGADVLMTIVRKILSLQYLFGSM